MILQLPSSKHEKDSSSVATNATSEASWISFPLFVFYQIMLSNNEFAKDAIVEKAENFLGRGGVKVSISFILAIAYERSLRT